MVRINAARVAVRGRTVRRRWRISDARGKPLPVRAVSSSPQRCARARTSLEADASARKAPTLVRIGVLDSLRGAPETSPPRRQGWRRGACLPDQAAFSPTCPEGTRLRDASGGSPFARAYRCPVLSEPKRPGRAVWRRVPSAVGVVTAADEMGGESGGDAYQARVGRGAGPSVAGEGFRGWRDGGGQGARR